ncbi:DUF1360 domain-containing protein [Streptomyces sp. NPDC002668]|uniref:DUF1360 domain-containing protein n=1 Tax=Streptomyces sp. NPDC002668 TaxID=3154422 RepID=UPI00332F78A8
MRTPRRTPCPSAAQCRCTTGLPHPRGWSLPCEVLRALVILAAADYRGTQLVVHDSILDATRDWLTAWHGRNPDSGTRTALFTLISCAYCSGWWVSGVLLATWLLVSGQFDDAPLLVHAIEWLAVAGADDTAPPEAPAGTLIHGRRASAPHRM